ncbi:MAG: sugar ABC transporter permease [Anaerolineae bacterium]|nr:sugar ABC transporter permease [Anaerolineae bacterium]MBN8619509.1 sugar ABC transporter permease [Anaerolineae bacterium]
MAITTQLMARGNALFSLAQRRGVRDTISGYMFLLPFFVLYCLLKLWPIVNGFWISLHRWETIGTNVSFIGLGNYQRILQDRLFWEAVQHTLYFTALSTPTLIIGGLCLALILNRPLFSGGVFRTLYYLPNVLSTAVVGLIFLAVLGSSDSGLVNAFLGKLGISPISFMLDSGWAMPSVAFATLWWTVGFNMLILLAGLQSVPDEINDAAKVDGANDWQRFWRITLPLLRRPLMLVTILQVISSFQVFGQIDVMTKGGPGGQTRSIVYYIFERSFKEYQLGYGSAIAFLLFVVLFVLSISQLRLFSREEDVI